VARLCLDTDNRNVFFRGLNWRGSPYGAVASARCSSWRKGAVHPGHSFCGFHAYIRRSDIPYNYVALASLILEIEGRGRFVEYEQIYRFEHQKVIAVTSLPCLLCSRPSVEWSACQWGMVAGRVDLIGSCGRHSLLQSDTAVSFSQLQAILGEHEVSLHKASLTAKQIWEGEGT